VTHPAANACLNAAAGIFLVAGYCAIRARKIDLHRALMGAALLCSTVFLASYLYYHYNVGSVKYQGEYRPIYFSILISHTVLAVAIVPMILRGLFLAWKERFDEHARLSRWTFPLWLYVSVTGVVVYWMLYRMSPAAL
jgi:putative membrane protein